MFFEELAYLADEVMEEAFDEELDLELDFPAEPRGDKWDETEVESLYPKLAAMYA